jgi:hypothetical protein
MARVHNIDLPKIHDFRMLKSRKLCPFDLIRIRGKAADAAAFDPKP